ncbi:MAG: DUF2760 domain-containing protein [Hahellaceae bacterium]|nr:DUF2760 domain-containing protein [Hahellaceae bacterium]
MNFDFSTFSHSPITLDLLHLILAAVVIVLAVLLGQRRKSTPAAQPAAPQTQPVVEAKVAAPAEPEAKPEEKPAPVAPALQSASPDAALQLLALLQQDARFIDFINEDLAGFSDAEIGAVARVVHEGSKKTINHYFRLSNIRTEAEESRVSIAAGFNPSELRLTGNLVGSGPYNGTLVHRGWKVTNVQLPKLAPHHDTSIITPAEVEL